MKKLFLLLLGCAVLTSCTTPITLVYTPGSLITGKGEIKVEPFKYVPAQKGIVQPNQIRNTAIGSIQLNENIDQFVTNAILSEFKYAGYTIRSGKLTLFGEIREFLADDLGYSVDWTFDVDYDLRSDETGKSLITKAVHVSYRSDKFVGALNAVSLVIRSSFDDLMKDQVVRSALDAR